MNKNAGRNNWLIVTVGLENGQKLPMIVDTGSPVTCFDTNLESTLGKRLGAGTFWNFGKKHNIGIYAAPKLYLGRSLLKMTGTNVVGDNFTQLSSDAGRPVMGILGMDVLEHYCVQLDFKRGKMRFLDDEPASKEDWGKPFPLTDIGDGCFAVSENLVGAKGRGSEIDTGCSFDGWLIPTLFQQWTNHAMPPAKGEAHSPEGVLGGQIYHELDLHDLHKDDYEHMKFNGIGLHILSQNLVTFDFPKRTMYLRRTSKWPLYDKSLVSEAKWEIKPVLKVLKRLKRKGRLPGWKKSDHGEATFFFHYNFESVTLDGRKKGDSSLYHYTLIRTIEAKAPAFRCPRQVGNYRDTFASASKATSWKLQKAWRTDQYGRIIEEYPIPQEPHPR